jgi:flagellar basal-body rod protein FlgF/flagellar basal-body rod protein FlgG
MFYGLYISAEGARAQDERLEVISNNLANVSTAGFKRDLAVFQARMSEANERGLDSPGSGSINDLGGGVGLRETVTAFKQGPLQETERTNDLAIEGEGFFVVRDGDRDYLTRAGNFILQANGDLVTTDGFHVISDEGEPVNIAPENGPYRFTIDGFVEQAASRIGLALVKPRSLGDLSKVGDNLFNPLAPTDPIEPSQRRVRSGFLEKSAVNPTSEMMQLIETSRMFEANVHLIQNQDQMFGALISRVLKS